MKRSAVWLIGLAVLAAACAGPTGEYPVTPSTYEIAREPALHYTVGKLRRLALITPPVGYDERAWRWSFQQPESADIVRHFLVDEKGYEVTVNADGAGGEALDHCAVGLAEWAEKAHPGDLPPNNLAGCAHEVGTRLRVDGLVLAWGGLPDFRVGAKDLLLMLPTFGFSEIWTLSKFQGTFRGCVVEVATGRLVWNQIAAGELNASDVTEALFGDIEPALPAVFEAR